MMMKKEGLGRMMPTKVKWIVVARNVGGVEMIVGLMGEVAELGRGRMKRMRVVGEGELVDVMVAAEEGEAVVGEEDGWKWLRVDGERSHSEGFHDAWSPFPLSGC